MKTGSLRFVRISLIVFTVALAVLLVIALNLTPESDKQGDSIRFLIGVSQANLTDPWRVSMNQEMKNEASKYEGVKLIFSDGGMSSDKQIADIEKMLALGIDLLIVSPDDEDALQDIIAKAYEKIPVIVLDREIPNQKYTLFIGADNYLVGKEAGEAAIKLLGASGGQIIEIRGSDSSYQAVERSEGFREALKNADNIRIEESISADWIRDIAEDSMIEKLAQYPDVDLVFAHNDQMAYGAYIAAKKMRIEGIIFMGVGGLPGRNGGRQMVETGILQATFANTFADAKVISYAMDILLKKNADLPKKIVLKTEAIIREP